MRKPRILISPDVALAGQAPRDRIQLNFEYLQAITSSGGVPIVAAPFADPEELQQLADAWLITGGHDLPPHKFGQEPHPKTQTAHEARITNEETLYGFLSKTDIPIFGICFGSQFLNVINGGTLQQHLPDILGHERHTEGTTIITAVPESKLEKIIFAEPIEVKCFHHQTIENVAPDWAASAFSNDGVIEAIEEKSDRWRLAVQWHPERSMNTKASQDLFVNFIAAANRYSAPALRG